MKLSAISNDQLKESGGVNFHLATIKREPEWFNEKYNCTFEIEHDDLEEFQFSSMRFGETEFGLQQYKSEKGSGTAIIIHDQLKKRDHFLNHLLESLGVDEESVIWKHSSAEGVFIRDFMHKVHENLLARKPLIQILTGPRQVGKTTGAKYIAKQWQGEVIFETAEGTPMKSAEWLANIWAQASQRENTLLIIDEFQKIANWSETIKYLWDKQGNVPKVKLLLLGSNSLFMDKKLSESLAGRFELTYVPHWNFSEYHSAFNTGLDDYLLFGGYPKAAEYIGDFDKWSNYISNSIITPVVSVDIPFSSNKNTLKVAQFLTVLGQHLGEITPYSLLAHELPANTNSKIVKEYLELFEGVYFCTRLNKMTKSNLKRESTPALLPLFTSFLSFFSKLDHFKDASHKEKYLKVAVGQRLYELKKGNLSYWKEGHQEIDFIYDYNGKKFALQVCEKWDVNRTKSVDMFKKEFAGSRSVQISEEVFESFSKDPDAYLDSMAV